MVLQRGAGGRFAQQLRQVRTRAQGCMHRFFRFLLSTAAPLASIVCMQGARMVADIALLSKPLTHCCGLRSRPRRKQASKASGARRVAQRGAQASAVAVAEAPARAPVSGDKVCVCGVLFLLFVVALSVDSSVDSRCRRDRQGESREPAMADETRAPPAVHARSSTHGPHTTTTATTQTDQGALRALADRQPARRRRAHRALQLDLRAQDRRQVRAARRGHGHGALDARVRGGDEGGPALARARLGRG